MTKSCVKEPLATANTMYLEGKVYIYFGLFVSGFFTCFVVNTAVNNRVGLGQGPFFPRNP